MDSQSILMTQLVLLDYLQFLLQVHDLLGHLVDLRLQDGVGDGEFGKFCKVLFVLLLGGHWVRGTYWSTVTGLSFLLLSLLQNSFLISFPKKNY